MTDSSPQARQGAFFLADCNLVWTPLAGESLSPPAAWRDWLQEPDSLTARLRALSQGDFAVEVLAEGWLEIPDRSLLGQFAPLAAPARFWSRQVQLWGRGQPWVKAHTLIPEYSLHGPLKRLLSLNEQPLGEYLFARQPVCRGSLEIARVGATAWARRSVFYLHRHPLMVAESFLPALLAVSGETARPRLAAHS